MKNIKTAAAKCDKCKCKFWFAKATVPVEYRCMGSQKEITEKNLTEEKLDWCPIQSVPLSLACVRIIEELNKEEDFYKAFRTGLINTITDADISFFTKPEEIADKIIKRITGEEP